MTETRTWTPEIQIGYPQIVELALAPDGRRAVFVAREPLLTDEKSEFVTHLYLAAADGGAPIQLTFGEHSASAPRWSPDGQHLAFVSARSGRANLYALRAGGGEAWPLTRYEKTDVAAPRWSADGRRIAFLMAEPHSDEKEKAIKAKNDPLLWEVDFDFTQLFVVPFEIGPRKPAEAAQITRGRRQIVGFDWFPDGERLAVTHRPSPAEDTWTETWLATVPAGGGELSDVARVADWGGPRVSPDGRWVACATADAPIRWAFANRVVLYPAGGGEPRPLAITPDEQSWLVGWSADSRAVYALDNVGLANQIWALPADGSEARQISRSRAVKTAVDSRGDTIAFAGEDFDAPNAVYLLDPASGDERLIAAAPLPAGWPDAALPQAEELRWESPDGRQIEGVLIYPLGYQPGQRCPLVVEVHGGPAGVYQRTYLGSADQYADLVGLAERGFAILRPNPRGSSGYGREFRHANRGDWGGGDYRDIIAGVDALVARGVADPERLGIMGWSYGGYMTSWAITQTDRFKAACVGAGVTNLMSFNGTSDIPSFVPDYFGAEAWDDLAPYRDHSAIFQIRGAKTPTLIQHGDSDLRVPLSQGRELYNALRRQGTPVEMVIYPRQPHWPAEPRLLVDIHRRVVEWFVRWIKF